MAAPAQTTEGLPLLLSVTRTARLVGVSVRAVNGLIADGTLQAVDADPPDGAGQEVCVGCLLRHVHQHLSGGAS